MYTRAVLYKQCTLFVYKKYTNHALILIRVLTSTDKNLSQMFTLARRVRTIHLRARIRVLHSRLTKWHETFHLMYIKQAKKHLCITVGLEIA